MNLSQVGISIIVLSALLPPILTSDSTDSLAEVDKRRGWGKRDSGGLNKQNELEVPSVPDLDDLGVYLEGNTILDDDSVAEDVGELNKRRGWGKRAFTVFPGVGDQSDWEGTDEDLNDDVDKRRGWGKRSFDDVSKRRGWGKRSDSEMDKRRGWGKRSDSEMDKRRGWGKRSDLEMDKRRGWGKRSDSEMDKRRGWGKRSDLDMDKRRGWGKRASEDVIQYDDVDKRRGWGKRSMAGVEMMIKRRGWGKRSPDVNEESAFSDDDILTESVFCGQLKDKAKYHAAAALEIQLARKEHCSAL